MSRPRLYCAALAALVTGLLAFLAGAPSTFAQVPLPEPNDPAAIAPAATDQSVIVTHGSPAWTFVVVAAIAMIVTVLVLLSVQRRWHARRSLIAAC